MDLSTPVSAVGMAFFGGSFLLAGKQKSVKSYYLAAGSFFLAAIFRLSPYSFGEDVSWHRLVVFGLMAIGTSIGLWRIFTGLSNGR